MKVLVSGGAGYIGSVTVERLIAHGASVVVFDNLYQGHRAAVHPDAIFIQGDLADREAVDAAIAAHRPDGIMHFASYTLVGESWQKPFLYLRDNVVNGLNLMESAVRHGVGRFILSSTANLFDDPQRIPIEPSERIVPGSPYGESKHILERELLWLDRIYGLRYACLRYFNACGATDERGEDHDPPLFQVAVSAQRQVRLGNLRHVDGGLHAAVHALLLEEVLQCEAVHNGAEHAHVIAAAAVDAGLLKFCSAEEVAAAGDDGYLNTLTYCGNDFLGDAPHHFRINADCSPAERFA